eukprot:1195045-Prorocentrum_minimum.AAC.1
MTSPAANQLLLQPPYPAANQLLPPQPAANQLLPPQPAANQLAADLAQTTDDGGTSAALAAVDQLLLQHYNLLANQLLPPQPAANQLLLPYNPVANPHGVPWDNLSQCSSTSQRPANTDPETQTRRPADTDPETRSRPRAGDPHTRTRRPADTDPQTRTPRPGIPHIQTRRTRLSGPVTRQTRASRIEARADSPLVTSGLADPARAATASAVRQPGEGSGRLPVVTKSDATAGDRGGRAATVRRPAPAAAPPLVTFASLRFPSSSPPPAELRNEEGRGRTVSPKRPPQVKQKLDFDKCDRHPSPAKPLRGRLMQAAPRGGLTQAAPRGGLTQAAPRGGLTTDLSWELLPEVFTEGSNHRFGHFGHEGSSSTPVVAYSRRRTPRDQTRRPGGSADLGMMRGGLGPLDPCAQTRWPAGVDPGMRGLLGPGDPRVQTNLGGGGGPRRVWPQSHPTRPTRPTTAYPNPPATDYTRRCGLNHTQPGQPGQLQQTQTRQQPTTPACRCGLNYTQPGQPGQLQQTQSPSVIAPLISGSVRSPLIRAPPAVVPCRVDGNDENRCPRDNPTTNGQLTKARVPLCRPDIPHIHTLGVYERFFPLSCACLDDVTDATNDAGGRLNLPGGWAKQYRCNLDAANIVSQGTKRQRRSPVPWWQVNK